MHNTWCIELFYVEFNFVVLEWITIYLELAFQAILSNVLPSFEACRFWARFAYLHMMGAWTHWSFDPNSKLVHPSQQCCNNKTLTSRRTLLTLCICVVQTSTISILVASGLCELDTQPHCAHVRAKILYP